MLHPADNTTLLYDRTHTREYEKPLIITVDAKKPKNTTQWRREREMKRYQRKIQIHQSGTLHTSNQGAHHKSTHPTHQYTVDDADYIHTRGYSYLKQEQGHGDKTIVTTKHLPHFQHVDANRADYFYWPTIPHYTYKDAEPNVPATYNLPGVIPSYLADVVPIQAELDTYHTLNYGTINKEAHHTIQQPDISAMVFMQIT